MQRGEENKQKRVSNTARGLHARLRGFSGRFNAIFRRIRNGNTFFPIKSWHAADAVELPVVTLIISYRSVSMCTGKEYHARRKPGFNHITSLLNGNTHHSQLCIANSTLHSKKKIQKNTKWCVGNAVRCDIFAASPSLTLTSLYFHGLQHALCCWWKNRWAVLETAKLTECGNPVSETMPVVSNTQRVNDSTNNGAYL